MDFNEIKNKVSRKLRNFHIGTLGAIVCTAQLLLELYSFAIALFIFNSPSFPDIFFLVINCIFDLYLVRYFITSKENNSLNPARTAIVLLLISFYVLPSIESAILGIFTTGLGATLLGILLSGVVLGIAYFIFLILEYRHKGKRNHLAMIILGSIMTLIGIAQGALSLTMGVISFISSTNILYDSLMLVYYCLGLIVTVGMPVIFLLYPIYAIRQERRGF